MTKPNNGTNSTIKIIKKTDEKMENMVIKSLLVLYSYHHNNTEKIANLFAKVLDAQVKGPQQINPEELQEYSLIGFGSGIYGVKHHQFLLNLADKLPPVTNRKAFIIKLLLSSKP